MVGLDADEDFLGQAVLFGQVVTVVGCHQSDVQLSCQPNQLRQDVLLLLDAVVLQLDEKVVLAEHIQIKLRGFLCLPVIVAGQRARNLACQTS